LVIKLNLDKRVEEKETAAGYMGLGESIWSWWVSRFEVDELLSVSVGWGLERGNWGEEKTERDWSFN
jgi:hypothetical protein